MIEKLPEESDQQLHAMLALAAGEADPAGDCPPDEQLAAFIDGELNSDARRAMLTHLDRCPACRQHWLEVADLVNSGAPEPVPAPQHQKSLIDMVRQGWQELLTPWKLAVSSAAVATVIGLAVVLSITPNIGQQIDKQYAAKLPDSTVLAQQAQEMPMPWDSATLGFSESAPSLPKRAFGAGVWSGRTALIGDEDALLPAVLSPPDQASWSETAWSDYYQFGRWAVLLWTQASTEQATVDLDGHRKLMVALQARIDERRGRWLRLTRSLLRPSDMQTPAPMPI